MPSFSFYFSLIDGFVLAFISEVSAKSLIGFIILGLFLVLNLALGMALLNALFWSILLIPKISQPIYLMKIPLEETKIKTFDRAELGKATISAVLFYPINSFPN